MATVRAGPKAALLVIDVQVGVMSECWETARVVAQVARAIERARAQQVPVIWVQHADHNLAEGSPEWAIVPQLQAAPGERFIRKRFNSCFEQTDLEAQLAELGVSRMVLSGAATNWCIRATAYAGLERGYDVTLVSDAHTTGTMTLDSGEQIDAATVIHDLNTAMTWLRYPGRRNDVATAEAVAFSSAA
jgi:nicotinamidase-related amidase